MTPLVRINLPCGTDQNISAGREPCQNGWYEWAGKKYCVGKRVLDVGAGMCDGMKLLRSAGASQVFGQDIDSRLRQLDENLIIGDVLSLDLKRFDIVTSFDVIEHIIEDVEFFHNLQKLAKEMIIITTPNFTRSQARNHCHCREYTLPQFVNIFKPDELWVASPDGRVHHTLLLSKNDDCYTDMTRNNTTYFCGNVPLDLTFNHSTVDGQEWPHMCGVFKQLNLSS